MGEVRRGLRGEEGGGDEGQATLLRLALSFFLSFFCPQDCTEIYSRCSDVTPLLPLPRAC